MARRKPATVHGLLAIDKPAGITSHDVVDRVRRLLHERKVGHSGTLDPDATGVLLLGVGDATRLLRYLDVVPGGTVESPVTSKAYTAEVVLGTETSTLDASGEVTATHDMSEVVAGLTIESLQRVVDANLSGPIMQVPPMVSAVHHQGQRLYHLARSGQVVERTPRPVHIHRLTLLEVQASCISLEVVCGKGTYIRSLARDLGEHLGCGAHLATLQRTAVGPFTLADAVSLAALNDRTTVLAHLLPPTVALSGWMQLELDAAMCVALRHGRAIPASADAAVTRAYACDADGGLVALVERDGAQWQPRKVFAREA